MSCITITLVVVVAQSGQAMSDNGLRKERRVECFSLKCGDRGYEPIWSFLQKGDPSIPCLIVNVSRNGIALLVNKRYGLPPERAKITISDPAGQISIALKASLGIRWTREDFSIDNKLVGLLVQPDTLRDIQQLNTLVTRAARDNYDYWRCSVLPLSD